MQISKDKDLQIGETRYNTEYKGQKIYNSGGQSLESHLKNGRN
jgi:hypothetical protein